MITGQLGTEFILQDRYEIVGQLGKGGMGVVYLANDLRLTGRQWAVKELSPAFVPPSWQSGAISAFQQEAQVLARLSHPGLARVTDVFEQSDNWYLVMEYIAGQSLEQLLASSPGGRVPAHQALDIVRQLCEVLMYLHDHRPPIIFRDLKPSNVMVLADGNIKLIDFGIARFFKPGQARDTQIMGTPGYAAPEQYGHGQSDPRTDVYAMGVLLHQLLTGYDPTAGVTPFSLPPAESLNPTVPLEAIQAIRQATEHDPARRYPSVSRFHRVLFSGVRGTPAVQDGRKPPPPAGIPRWVWARCRRGRRCVGFDRVRRNRADRPGQIVRKTHR